MNTPLAGIVIGGMTGGTWLLADVATAVTVADISGKSTIGLQEAMAVGMFVCGLVWWMGRKFQSIESDIKEIKHKLKCHDTEDESDP